MLTRRNMLLASIAAGALMHNRDVLAKAAQPSTPVSFEVPAGACDCHTHIHGDVEKFPFFDGRVGPGLDQFGCRTSDEDYEGLLKRMPKRPIDYFRMFYADTALFRDAVRAVLTARLAGPGCSTTFTGNHRHR